MTNISQIIVFDNGNQIADKIKETIKTLENGHSIIVSLVDNEDVLLEKPAILLLPNDVIYQKVEVEKIEDFKIEDLLNLCVSGQCLNASHYDNLSVQQQETLESYRLVTFKNGQVRLALHNVGVINPLKIDDYFMRFGYMALAKVLNKMSSEEIIETLKASNLRGRGGGGYLTGLKWEKCYNAISDEKYVICNADEGVPGGFMDRTIIEGDPHSIIEALIIAGYTIKAKRGYIHVRAEYQIAIENLRKALSDAYANGLLGNNILGSNFSFDIELRLGPGNFICGEETALIASIEGKRAMPNVKPPYTAIKGLYEKPTIVNNVETLKVIPLIILNGASWFKSFGVNGAAGTKIFALSGKINNNSLIEIPLGSPLKDLIYRFGGGTIRNKQFKALQAGGPTGGLLPERFLDLPLNYDAFLEASSMLGSGVINVLDEDYCIVDQCRFFMEFVVNESCGKCVSCREGTKRLLELLTKMTKGKANLNDLKKLKEIAEVVKNASLCGLGQTAPNAILTGLMYFEKEFLAHIEKTCPAGVCRDIVTYRVTSKCVGCGKCQRGCPVECISGSLRKMHYIDASRCIRCGACKSACPVSAITTGNEV